MKKALLFAGLLSISSFSVAEGWLDALSGLFGGGQKDESSQPAASPAASSPAMTTNTAQTTDFAAGLVPVLSKTLGVSSQQASGGMGALFGLAKSNVSAEDFSTLSQSVPSMSSLLAAAPEVAGGNDNLGSLLGSAGKYGKALTGAKQVYEQFSALGLDTAQVGQYLNVAMSYFQSEGGQATADIFSDGVSSLMGN